MAEDRIKVSPDVCSYVDDDESKIKVEIAIPGVPKENIDLRITEDSLSMTAPNGNIEYVTTLNFCCPVKPNDAKAEYKNGLLKLEIPFKDRMEDAVKISVE